MTNKLQEDVQLIPLIKGMDAIKANAAKAVLRQAGIDAFVSDGTLGLSPTGLQSVDLLVRRMDHEMAKKTLSNISAMPSPGMKTDGDGEALYCAHCGSERVHAYVGDVPTALPFVKRVAEPGGGWFHCLMCDTYFQNRLGRYSLLPAGLLWGALLAALTIAVIWIIEFLRFL